MAMSKYSGMDRSAVIRSMDRAAFVKCIDPYPVESIHSNTYIIISFMVHALLTTRQTDSDVLQKQPQAEGLVRPFAAWCFAAAVKQGQLQAEGQVRLSVACCFSVRKATLC